ncbi:MAG: hypothetical protein V4463_13670 [Pseudomonadota bacterium]
MSSLRHLLLCCLLFAGVRAGAADYTLYAYHLKPPYIIDRDKQVGLYFDMARYLNQHLTQHHFTTVYLPRRRLEMELELGRLNGMVIGVNPSWFKDDSRTRYLWSPPIVHDEDVVVSLASKPVEYEGPESLVGRHIGLSLGYYYFGVDELVRAGRIQRDDAINEEVTLDKLVRQRVDAAIVTRRTLDILLRTHPAWRKLFHVAKKPHDEFDRMILIPKEFATLAPELTAVLGPLMHDPAWIKMLHSH